MSDDAGAAGDTRRPRRRGTTLVTATAAVLLLGGGTAVAVGLAGRDAVTPPQLSAPAAPGAVLPSGPASTPAPAPAPTRTGTGSGPSATDAAPRPELEAPAPAAAPVAVSIPSIGVTSDLLHLGLMPDGTLEVPQGSDFDTAAWYSGSPRPGDTGPAVIEGHVSSAARGPSVFFDLARLEVGATVEVLRQDGTSAEFEVYDRRQFPKDGFPTLEVYGNTEGPELRLITCGGTIGDSGHFSDNVIVFARLVGP